MNLKELQGFYEAYMNVYGDVEESEELDEGNKAEREFQLSDPEKLAARNTSSAYFRFSPKDPKDPRRIRAKGALHIADQEKRQKRHKEKRGMKESYDNYDLVLEYLLDEGFCETEDKAEAMMAHMSEGWIESIIDEAKCDEGLSDAEKEMKRKQRGNGGPTSHNLRQGKKTRGNMSYKYESGKYQD
jgi:hypothetical protein